MTHRVSGLIARREPPAAFASEMGLRTGVAASGAGAETMAPEGFRRLTADVLHGPRGATGPGPFADVETDYFGGAGDQGALVIDGGALVIDGGALAFGPERGRRGPISRALRLIGVAQGAHDDAFEAVGLGARRRNEDWIAAGA